MAAGQQKKRLSASSVVGRNLQEQYRAKKKKRIESSHNVLSLRPHISLEWDDIKGSVVAEKGQIGITTRDMIAFMDCGTSSHMGLADVYSVHHEIFGLENLIGVLSYEVWETHLSESERELLVQFLPKGIDVDQVLQALFIGENFHFGNPFLHWGMSLCSGKVHPDAVVQAERFFRANKKAYYSELKKYHINMVEKLGKWKNRWFSCKDPEADIVQKKWRKDANMGFSPEANESRLYEVEDNFAATADSSSEIAEATVSTANRETNLGRCGGKPPKRKGLGKHGTGSTKVTFERATVVSNSKKEKVPHKLCFDSGDVAKYMSYFKVSKKQHQQVKKIKQNGEGIQSKSLNQVLGDIKGFNVQPYDLFEEEQRNLFHENWSLLAKRDLPAAFAHHEERRLQRQQWRKSLEQELSSKHLIDKDADTLESSVQEQEFGETENHSFTDHSIQEDDESMSSSTRNSDFQPMERISVNCHHELPMVPDLEATNQEILKQETTAPIISKYLNDMKPQADVIEQLATKATAKNVWSAVGMLDSYYHSPSMSHRYMSNGELSLCQPQPIKEQSPHLIDLETNTLNHEATESLLPLSCNEVGETALSIDSGGSLFGSYSNQDRNELLPNFLKGQEMLQSYSHDQTNDLNQLGLHFLPTNDSLQENSQFPRQFQEQEQRLFEQRQMREKEIYMHQMLQKKIYSNDRYLSREHFPTVDIHGRVTESVCVGPFQSLTNGIVLDGQNCFSAGAHIQSGWPNLEIPPPTSQGLGGGGDGSNTNENLYSVLPQYNQFPSRHAYSSTSSDNSFPSRNFVGGSVTGNAGVFQHLSHQLNYLNEHEVSAMKVNNSSWVNMQHSNSDIHDRTGRSFLGPWKQ